MIPSLLQIPSAVSDSKLHSVLPNNGKGDFTFDRSTGATRINKDGLIEEVGYFSSELVQNGNFSELGSELVTDGGFSSSTNWNTNDWFINNGKATLPITSTNNLHQSISITQNKTYKIVFTISNLSNGGVRIRLGTGSMSSTITTNGTHTLYMQHTTTNHVFRIYANTSGVFNGEIDNVSVKQVDPNDRWTLGTGWSYGDSVASCDGTDGVNMSQNNVVENGKTYKITFDISNYVSGTLSGRIGASGSNDFAITANGSYIFNLTSDGTSFIFRSSSFNGSISNISAVEVQGDRPRLSYDITNGVVEDKPHLLLEPSSTNKLTTSNDFSSYSKSGTITLTSNYGISPTGERNSTRVQFGGSNNSLYKLSVHSGNTESNSIHIKGVSGETIKFGKGTTVNAGNTFTLNGEWQRIQHQSTTGNQFAINTYSSVTARDIEIFGAQIEEQSYATSYIPTAGTTITRAAETCNNSKPSVNSTEGVLYAEIAALANDGNLRMININDGTQNNRAGLQYSSSNNVITAAYDISGAGQATLNHTLSSVTSFNKIAFKYKVNDFALYVNGAEVATDTSGSVLSANTLNNIDFEYGDNRFFFYGKVKGLAVYNEVLSESQLMQLTGVTASSIYNNFVTRTASFTVEALNEVKKVIDNL